MKPLSESSLVIFTTHKMLDSLATPGLPEPYSVAPSQWDEHWLGYDVRIRSMKSVQFQYKRARKRWTFRIDRWQLLALLLNTISRGMSFYALPCIWDEYEMRNALRQGNYLDRVTFIDVLDIHPGTNQLTYVRNSWQQV